MQKKIKLYQLYLANLKPDPGQVHLCEQSNQIKQNKLHRLLVCQILHRLLVCQKLHRLLDCQKLHRLLVCQKVTQTSSLPKITQTSSLPKITQTSSLPKLHRLLVWPKIRQSSCLSFADANVSLCHLCSLLKLLWQLLVCQKARHNNARVSSPMIDFCSLHWRVQFWTLTKKMW